MASNQRQYELRLFETILHDCSYLPHEQARTLIADPKFPMNKTVYGELAAYGFRRSGDNVYRPACPKCNACVPIRIPVDRFQPRRSQRRIAKRNADLSYSVRAGEFDESHFQLYKRYQQARHGDGEMARHQPLDYQGFLLSEWCDTLLVEMRLADELIGVAVVDQMHEGLSAVYTFFDPNHAARSPGVQAILWAIDEVRRRRLKWLYLGYWIGECDKMAYKQEYLPQERLREGQWLEWNGFAR